MRKRGWGLLVAAVTSLLLILVLAWWSGWLVIPRLYGLAGTESGRPFTPPPLEGILRERNVPVPLSRPRLVVKKGEYALTLYDGEMPLKTYPIALGFAPRGDKELEGDGRTPEGEFYVCQKVEHPVQRYLGTRWLRLSYPMPDDAERGLAQGLITPHEYEAIIGAAAAKGIPPQKTRLGGGIGIHGGGYLRNGEIVRNWTLGCIALFDADIEEFYDLIPLGTPVVVLP